MEQCSQGVRHLSKMVFDSCYSLFVVFSSDLSQAACIGLDTLLSVPFLFVVSVFIFYFYHIKLKIISSHVVSYKGKNSSKLYRSPVSRADFQLTTQQYRKPIISISQNLLSGIEEDEALDRCLRCDETYLCVQSTKVLGEYYVCICLYSLCVFIRLIFQTILSLINISYFGYLLSSLSMHDNIKLIIYSSF